MAAGRIIVAGWMPALDSDGAPIPNAQMYFYMNGTTSLATVYADSGLTTPLPNPVAANSSGQFPAIWADDANLFSVSIDAPYGPPGLPFTYDDLGPSTAANADATNKLDRDGSNAEDTATFRENIGIIELESDSVGLIRAGYIGDGASHTLAEVEPTRTLLEWQSIYPPNATTGSLGAVALSDQIDGLAAQKIIDSQAATGKVVLTLPPGRAKFTRGLVWKGGIDVTILGGGPEATVIDLAATSGRFVDAGTGSAVGSVRIEDMTVFGASSNCALYINSNAVPSVTLKNNQFLGFSGGGLIGVNITASQIDHNIFSANGGPTQRTSHCFAFTANGGCFQNFITYNQILAYDRAMDWVISTSPSYEGQYVLGNQINECNEAFCVTNTAVAYQSPDWKFRDNEIECFGRAVYFEKLHGLIFEATFYISLGAESVPEVFDFSEILGLDIDKNSLKMFNNPVKVWRFVGCVGTVFQNTTFDYLGSGVPTGAIHLGSGNGDFTERGSRFPAWPIASPKVTGSTTSQCIEQIALLAGASVARGGFYTLQATFAGTTDTNGILSVTFPTKPDGTNLFAVPPVVSPSLGDADNGGNDCVSVDTASTSGASFRFANAATGVASASVPRRVNYIVNGY